MRHVVELEGQLGAETSVTRLQKMMEECSILEKTPAMHSADSALKAYSILQDGECDVEKVVNCLQLCTGMTCCRLGVLHDLLCSKKPDAL